MCSDCEQDPDCLPPCGCQDCADCVEAERTVVRRLNTVNPCDTIVDTLKGIVGTPDPKCTVKINSVSVLADMVTINASSPNANLEYSSDNISFQDSPTFQDQACGTRKYYARQRTYTACIQAILVTVSENCSCVPNVQPVFPPVTDCIDGFVNVKTDDGCGHIGWTPTTTACNQCDETFTDVAPPVTQCHPSGFLEYFQTNGCGDTNWRLSQVSCNNCVVPTVPAAAVTQPATCNQQGQIQANGSFTFGPISGGDKYGIWAGNTYAGPDYSAASVIPSNNTIFVGGLQGQPYSNQYILRVFNQNNNCYIDKIIAFAGVTCTPACSYPTGTLYNTNPTCSSGGATNNNGLLTLINVTNSTRYQVCQATTFTCPPNYATATPIAGPGPFTILSNIGFSAGEQYKDYVVRVYNGNQSCYNDYPFRFTNPCYGGGGGGGGCVTPSYSGATPTAATCTGSTPNNDASIAITGISNSLRFGYSVGTVYSGPSYAGGTVFSGSSVNLGFLTGSQSATNYVVRLFSLTGECWIDIAVTVPGAGCGSSCVTPTSGSGVGSQATCTGSTVNNDASITIGSVANANRYGYSQGSSYTGPAYSSANTLIGSSISITGLAGVSGSTTYVVRIFNLANDCFKDVTVSVPGKTCPDSCVNPTFNISSVNPTACIGEASSNDGIVRISSINNATKYQVCIDTSFSCTPNYAGSPTISGSGPIDVINYLSFMNTDVSKTVFVRVYNGSESCYTDHSIVVSNPCKSCCSGFTINTLELNNL